MNDDLEKKYIALVERIRRMPGPPCNKAAILAEVEAIYRTARLRLCLGDTGCDIPGKCEGLQMRKTLCFKWWAV